jgi:hypothetical protein
LVCEGFLGQAAATSVGLGMPNLPVATIVGHPGAQSSEEIRRFAAEVTAAEVIANLTVQPEEVTFEPEPAEREIVFTGSFEEVNEHFIAREWSDGLPIVPPTLEKIEQFLAFTPRKPEETLGVVLPASRAVTVWATAVNGVMAGCRPEYMPVLVALAEAMCDPVYGVEHSGNTPGAETLIILNGPIIKQLKFNYEQGVLRDGFRANTSVGRFWRLALRNMAGFLPHKTDKGTFGNTFRVVLAENEDALARIGWPSNAEDMGFATGDNTVTITRLTGDALYCRRRRQGDRLGNRLHRRRADARHLAPGAGALADPGRDHCQGRLVEGRREAISLRPRPDDGGPGRGPDGALDRVQDPLAPTPGQHRQTAARLCGERRPRTAGADRRRSQGLHGAGLGRSLAHQRPGFRAQWLSGLSSGEADRAAGGLGGAGCWPIGYSPRRSRAPSR